VWDVVNRGFPPSGWTALAVIGALTALVYAVGWRPAVLAGADAVVVRNPFRTSTIPWNTVTDIDLTDALRIHTNVGIIRAWAIDRGGAASNMLRGMSSKRMVAKGVERSALEAMARRSPADFTVTVLTDLWRRQRNHAEGSVQVVWAWSVVGAFIGCAVVAAVLIAT
jgi:hypothetical protein